MRYPFDDDNQLAPILGAPRACAKWGNDAGTEVDAISGHGTPAGVGLCLHGRLVWQLVTNALDPGNAPPIATCALGLPF